MNKNHRLYLGKSGQISGPFTPEEFNRKRSTGEIYQYSWFWDTRFGGWEAIDPAPAFAPPAETGEDIIAGLLPGHPATPEQREEAAERYDEITQKRICPPPPVTRQPKAIPQKNIEAICHDNRSLVSGMLRQVTESGCVLVSSNPESGMCFPDKAALALDLLDPSTGRSTSVVARLSSTSRQGGQWAYAIRWQECPDLFQ